MSELGASLRYFSGGDDVDHREYRRWKTWVINKMNVMEKLPKNARGSFVWTLLQGRALELVEHLQDTDYMCEGGDVVIFNLLDARWPAKDRADEMGEHISEIFNLRAKEGETIRAWCGRARECFDRCKRKTGVSFPDEARGWILLQRSGMTEEQRAVVLARCKGDLKIDEVAQSMRSCYPEFSAPRRKTAGALVVEPRDGISADVPEYAERVSDAMPASDFEDIEMFLAEHYGQDPVEDELTYEEHEAADILAVSWKEKRQELNKLRQARQFHKEADTKKTYRIEVEELKKRTRCHKCKRLGHWARECKSGSRAQSSTSKPTTGSTHAASCVQLQLEEHFICAAVCEPRPLTLLERAALYRAEQIPVEHSVMLVSSPGYAVLDSGCGKTIIGRNTLEAFRDLWTQRGVPQPVTQSEENHFRYGNGEGELSTEVVEMPIMLAQKAGRVKAAIVKGDAPLLLSRPALKRLSAEMDFAKDELRLFAESKSMPMELNAAGQYMVSVADFPEPREPAVNNMPEPVKPIASVQNSPPSESLEHPAPVPSESTGVSIVGKKGKSKDYWVIRADTREVIRKHVRPRTEKFTPCHTHCPILAEELTSSRRTHWQLVGSNSPPSIVNDTWTDAKHAHEPIDTPPGTYWIGETVFTMSPDAQLPSGTNADEIMMTQWSPKQRRRLVQQVKQLPSASVNHTKYDVVEMFSPPRFAQQTATQGLSCLSADLVTGWDFRKASDRQAMRQLIRDSPPKLLVCCPPCTWAGGWFHLNRLFMSPEEEKQKTTLTTLFINFSCELMELQAQAGGHILFEHPRSSVAWSMPRVQRLERCMHVVDCDMRMFHLRIPKGNLIKKATRLLVSHDSMRALNKRCPGHAHPAHREHHPVAGSHPEVGSVSRFAGCYTQSFVKAVMQCVPSLRSQPVLSVTCHNPYECLVAARVRELSGDDVNKIRSSLLKLHENLGHPGNHNLTRLLKNAGASQTAIDMARELECESCKARVRPSPPLPAQPDRVTSFNKRIGIDIKHVPGWKVNQTIPALNIVDYASSYQVMVPIHEKVTSDSIRRAVQERWISWAGQPDEIVCDPARMNLSDCLTKPQELAGSTIHVTAADAHYQLGKVEVHGGWFEQILTRIISDHAPTSKEEWTECMIAAHCKNELIQVYGMTPAQFIFGRNPKVPEHLLDEPVEVIPATASLFEQEVARKVAIRQSARLAVVALQDNHALRRALAARPRHQKEPRPGELIAYWRSQKWEHGTLNHEGRWYGPGVVLGKIGRNFVIIHKRQIFRCAPEQLRPATSEEQQLVRAPHAELLGLKHAFEAGQIASRQYVDLVPGLYPRQEGNEDQDPPADGEPHREPASDPPEAPMPPVENPEPPRDSQPESLSAANSAEREALAEPIARPVSENPQAQASGYGPVRRRVTGRSDPIALYRPAPMKPADFQEMMDEVLPQLMQDVLQPESASASPVQMNRQLVPPVPNVHTAPNQPKVKVQPASLVPARLVTLVDMHPKS